MLVQFLHFFLLSLLFRTFFLHYPIVLMLIAQLALFENAKTVAALSLKLRVYLLQLLGNPTIIVLKFTLVVTMHP
jgi:hypothetical protein